MKITIITVVKNDEKNIETTIQSILNQNVDIEYIIIDGNSSDSTLNLIQKYKNKINLIISENDDGIYDAMNKGIRHANGDVIGFCNSGDVLNQGGLNHVINAFKKNNCDYVFATVKRNYTGSSIIKHGFDLKRIKYNFDFATAHTTGFYLKKNAYLEIGLYDTNFKCSADYDLYFRMINAKKYKGESTPQDIVIGEVARGGFSYETSFIEHLNEETKIRLKNRQSFIIIFIIYINALIKKIFK
tara:strand:+ start:1618 stop:2346 length:729 start_codon:yes stop_codon:yes gene_type:complete